MKLRNYYCLLGACIATIGCSDPNKPGTVSINPKLTRVIDWEPVYDPVWVSPSLLYVYTGLIVGSENLSGVFEIHIDPRTFRMASYLPYSFPDHIWTLTYDADRQRIIMIYFHRQDLSFRAAYVRLANRQVIIEKELVGPEWQPRGIVSWPGKPGAIFYGASPVDSVTGFYWRRPGNADSLLLQVALDVNDEARALSVRRDGRHLFFAQFVYAKRVTSFYRLDITQPGSQPVTIAQRIGSGGTIVPHPVEDKLLLLHYCFPGDAVHAPQGHLELFDTETQQGLDLDVRTHPFLSRFIVNDHPWWSPDGHHLAFSAGAFDGEGGKYDPELWIYRDVP